MMFGKAAGGRRVRLLRSASHNRLHALRSQV